MAAIIAGTLSLHRNSLHYHVFNKSYNAAFIDRYVQRLREMGVKFKFWSEVRRIDSDKEGGRINSIWYQDNDPAAGRSSRYVCENCGAENYFTDRVFCHAFGLDVTLEKVRAGAIRRPVAGQQWADPNRTETGGSTSRGSSLRSIRT